MVPVDRTKLRSHIDFVRRNVRRLEELRAEGKERFLADDRSQAAATRWLQTAVEALIDIGNHVIAREGFGVPRSYAETVEILAREEVLPRQDLDTYVKMVRFRNRVVHLYDDVDPEELWTILSEHLADLDTFIAAIVERYM